MIMDERFDYFSISTMASDDIDDEIEDQDLNNGIDEDCDEEDEDCSEEDESEEE